ncbi:MAG: hypothetical protein NC093_03970 [Alistipes sp.]|nr:hypothetical protein [Alistipes sp.]
MLKKYDYRFCIKASLQVMRKQRENIYADSCSNYLIYSGLHETNEKLQMLYFQYYLIEWLESHWGRMQDILDRHPEYTIDQKRDFTLFYAEYFSNMLDSWVLSGMLSKIMIPDILQSLKATVRELIIFSDKWEQNSNRLKLLLKKHKEQFEYLIGQEE